jgi:hypothetical protein
MQGGRLIPIYWPATVIDSGVVRSVLNFVQYSAVIQKVFDARKVLPLAVVANDFYQLPRCKAAKLVWLSPIKRGHSSPEPPDELQCVH